MKSFKEFLDEEIANTMGSGHIAQPDNPMKLKKKNDYMGAKVFEISHDDYCNCIQKGKVLGDKWKKYIKDSEAISVLKREFYKKKPVIVQSDLTKQMIYLRR